MRKICSCYLYECTVCLAISELKYFCITGDHFIKLGNTWCHKQYGDYSSIVEAQASCLADDNCQGVYNSLCDGNSFKLCPMDTSYQLSNFDYNSCVYQKNQGSSVIIIIITFTKC